jgi:hypothetical protein
MEHKIHDRPLTSAGSSKAVTFSEAEDLGAFELARQWTDRLSWAVLDRPAADELAELAYMSALACWLARWQPIHIHSAILAGAEPAAVADAFGGSVAGAFQRWHEWATRQRDVLVCGKPGITAEEYETVARVFAAAVVTAPGEGPRCD